MRVVVTGGAGYIGSITVRLLADAGFDVVVLDTLEKGHAKAVDPRAELHLGDVGCDDALDAALSGADAVLHCAGYIEVAESMEDPGRYFENNVARPLTMLRAMDRNGVNALVFSSTAAVYGEPVTTPIPEDAPTVPINAYGASKLLFEQAIEWHARLRGLNAVVLRYFNVAGAWPDGTLGEAHEPETHIIPRILARIAAGQRDFEVFGGDYPTPDGTCVRDYLHVADLARAHRLALERAANGGGGIFNLGNGEGHSNLAVLAACAEATGTEIDPRIGPRRPGDPAVLVASSERANSELGWHPELPAVGDMAKHAWEWHRTHPRGYGE